MECKIGEQLAALDQRRQLFATWMCDVWGWSEPKAPATGVEDLEGEICWGLDEKDPSGKQKADVISVNTFEYERDMFVRFHLQQGHLDLPLCIMKAVKGSYFEALVETMPQDLLPPKDLPRPIVAPVFEIALRHIPTTVVHVCAAILTSVYHGKLIGVHQPEEYRKHYLYFGLSQYAFAEGDRQTTTR